MHSLTAGHLKFYGYTLFGLSMIIVQRAHAALNIPVVSFAETPSLPESIMETCSVVLTFESVDEILWCDHSNETSSAVHLHGTICFSIFYKMKLGIFGKQSDLEVTSPTRPLFKS